MFEGGLEQVILVTGSREYNPRVNFTLISGSAAVAAVRVGAYATAAAADQSPNRDCWLDSVEAAQTYLHTAFERSFVLLLL